MEWHVKAASASWNWENKRDLEFVSVHAPLEGFQSLSMRKRWKITLRSGTVSILRTVKTFEGEAMTTESLQSEIRGCIDFGPTLATEC